ncbi:hypothetical protein UA08_09362 [Talaromyces atroroseus]|uniref:O-methyltransferase domain-containing protein n=1 Tax=Talaromyces atroroseus TaxID=1441469 RepID=A0A1Q5Q6R6_TALAT|nr:hypothetical protein UA08_09362 [Talaromyces atroroseus]OKL55381.1 hypothetical protein UA08_09362 [Talaromyces atroroseus]
MDDLMELEVQSDQLAAAVKNYVRHRRDLKCPGANSDMYKELNKAKTTIHASMAKMQTLLCGPVDFLQDFARQVEIVACLKWLAEFQILACIPLDGSISIRDLADLAGVPKTQLSRIIRLTATSGFLQEPIANHVSHTPLSAQFMVNQSLLDAAVFMAEFAAPAALHMPMATERFGSPKSPTETAYNLALNTMRPFNVAIQERHKLGRQWSAYLHQAVGLHQEKEIVDMLSQLKWSNLGNASIVEIGAQSTSMAQQLAKRFPTLRLIVQIDHTRTSILSLDSMRPQNEMIAGFAAQDGEVLAELDPSEPNTNSITIPSTSNTSRPSSTSSRITVRYRAVGVPQPVIHAAVYILHLPVLSINAPCGAEGIMEMIKTELQDYLGILRASAGILLIPTANLLPEPGSLSDPKAEAVARARDLNMFQLANEGEIEMTELLSVVETIRDGVGKLVVNNQLRSHNGLVVGLTIKQEAYS